MVSLKLFIQSKRYFASAFLYACFSLIFSTWVTYIPHISDKLGITEGRIGKAIFFSGFGAFFMIRIARRVVDRIGVGRYAFYALLGYSASFFLLFLAWNYTALCAALFIFGMAGASYGISINSLTATIEKQDGVYVMSGSHGFWSMGGMIGSATGSFLAALVHNPILHISLLISAILAIHISLRKEYYHRRGEHHEEEKTQQANLKPLFIIALIGLVVMVSEGAIADWSALYLKKIIHLDLKYIGFGYSAFSLAMMIGRFTGDNLSKKLGSWLLITYASLIAIAGFAMVLFLRPAISLPGFFIIGLGFSVIVPEVYRLASKVEGVKTAYGVAFVAATSNIGFLVGPVLLGFVAEMRSLHLSFMVLNIWVSLAFIFAFVKYRNSLRLVKV